MDIYKMPKPKSGELYIRELRITPPDQIPITDWHVNDDDFKVLLACQEGGNDGKKLHYHLYVECTRSESWLKKWIYTVAHCYNQESGNSVYFSRKPHENTIGYVVKGANIVCRHGCAQSFIDEWLAKSDDYKRVKERDRKRAQRSRTTILSEILKTMESDLKGDNSIRTINWISSHLIQCYKEHDCYPTKAQHEMMVIKLIHPYDDYFVRSFYEKHLMNN